MFVQLGRLGDIINVLPLMWAETRAGRKANLMVSKSYFPILDGTSYVNPVIWEGDFGDLRGALASQQNKWQDIKTTQVYGHGMSFPHHTSSFLHESYNQVGRAGDFGKLPLIFDRRDYQREKVLVQKVTSKKPFVLVACNGISSPFQHGGELKQLLTREFGNQFDIIDLSTIFAHRFYDLLGLFDKARCLVTIDTGHMHLARASKVPVVALVTNGPTPWHSSAPLEGQILRVMYNDFKTRQSEIVSAIGNIRSSGYSAKPLPKSVGTKLIHVYNDYPERNAESRERHLFARSTWLNEYGNGHWIEHPVRMEHLRRSSKSFGDTRSMPFIRDLVEDAITRGQANPEDVIVLTNDDVSFVEGLGAWIGETSDQRAAWANRWDFRKLQNFLPTEIVRTGIWCVGTDCFAFTVGWWNLHKQTYPDFVLGCEAWDWVLREVIRDSGGFEIHAMLYHQHHQSFWQSGDNRYKNPGNHHNQKLAKRWLVDHGKPLRELANV